MTNLFKDLPENAQFISIENNSVTECQFPVIGYIEGDGIGKEVWPAAQQVIDAAIKKAYKDQRKIHWVAFPAGKQAYYDTGSYLPEETLEAIKKVKVAIKGPLTTPVGGGIRSLNVTLRQTLDLFACVRPVIYFEGAPSPMKQPEKLDVVIFRENTEDVYAGIEYKKGSSQALDLISYFNDYFGTNIRKDSGLGLKPISEFASKRIVRTAIKYALEHNRKSVTIVHKGNIMKYTEGAFRQWGYELIEEEFRGKVINEIQLYDDYSGVQPDDKIVLKDRIADAMFQELLIHPDLYEVIVTTNLNGDYLSDACAAQVGGLGIAPGANMSDTIALFEATHGTAPTIAGKDIANPTSLLLSGVMMLEYLNWNEAADAIKNAVSSCIQNKRITCDMNMSGAKVLKCSEYTQELINTI